MTITHTQVNIIIALLSIIAFCVGTFLAQDWYYSIRSHLQARAMKKKGESEWAELQAAKCPHTSGLATQDRSHQ